MKYHNPITRKSHRKGAANKSQKTHSVSVENLTPSALHALSRKGLWGLLLFLIVSVAAFMAQDFNLYKTFPEPVLQVLGCPPPEILIHLALTCYSFTVIVPVLIRMATGESPVIGWHHLPYRAAFYFFYLVSMTLPENFVAAVTVGILLYAVEQISIWAYLYKTLRVNEVSG
ncbi:MAG: hypothetical protein JRC99_07770 [Deltaproteobacteria bacterium]|nr:hypothetical protein [Deltaproteobacteria bacterium]RLB67760.1 MAG: hypothetical protein DRH08_02820 [Deltaproteobacteria bacterium]